MIDIDDVLVDTNVLIEALSRKEPALTLVRRLALGRRLVLSSVVVAEFLMGASKAEQEGMEKLCREFPVLAVDLEVAYRAAKYQREYLSKRTKVPLIDCLVAAQCLVSGLRLATFNQKDYPGDVRLYPI